MIKNYDYRQLENGIRELLLKTASSLDSEHVRMIHDLIEAAEYGEAYDLLSSVIAKAKVSISTDDYARFGELGVMMGLDPEVWEKLRP